ncbi:hypothetical protein CDAR_499971 [Caerostris darwini]|uniref:Endonuclease/exonuclease/phosphatase domain-containing protein n=1 Tax=Caerostris darwini TaxID=1538125 RepID=A0AAV4MVQ2_9ARAC|nr:hypothetical protein CDAR_499971 [Caerostris darwini]
MAENSDIDSSILPIEEVSMEGHNMELDCESMIQALAFYDKIVEHSNVKDIKKKVKKLIRVNALAMVNIVASQNIYIAQLEGRLQEMERNLSVKATAQPNQIGEVVAREQASNIPENKAPPSISYADKVRNGAPTERIKGVQKKKVVKKFVTTVKPKEDATSLNDSDCLLISTYCPPKGDLASHLQVLQAFLVKYPLFKIFICGDFNAKSRVWGKRNVDARGTQILAFCNAMDLTIQNSPSSLPTFDCSRGQSWIDLLLTKNLDTGISMEVTDDISNSDHNLFHFSWSVDHLPPPERIHITISQSNWFL